MIPQTYPLYATRGGRTFLIVGWVTFVGVSQVFPVIAPLDGTAVTQIYRGPDLAISVQPPAHDPDATEVMSRIGAIY